ncbi:S8 family peptidase [Sphingomonas sp. PR090111-T3T-6A]|uniref:S8 family peptidase n=1 Tax=Sphingomonas sp. PR090111-T3T-6A TaxID=685778 RepID=UPI0003670A47|nr:S8 family serine peptidase [Sphingomonas sp. PR090111-T3T-6A]
MNRLVWGIGLLLAGLIGIASPAWSADTPSSGQQILVLLRLAPEHYRPGSDYGGSYGSSPASGARDRLARHIAKAHGLTLVTDWPMPLLGLDCYIMAVPEGQSTDAAAAEVSHDAGVAWSEPMHVYRAQGNAAWKDDPLFRAEPAAHEWRLADLHKIATGRGVTVAVIDSRIESNHPDLVGQVSVQQDFVGDGNAAPEQHGTGVAGIIAAIAGNGIGIAGVAPRAKLMGLRACWQTAGKTPAAPDTLCNSLSLAKALHFAIDHRAQIINMSLSGPPDPLLGRLIDVGLARGATLVAAIDPNQPDGGFPASHPGVVAVAEESMVPPPAKGYLAPGRDIPTTQPGDRWYLVNGSSYAAAHVSGLAALLREKHMAAGSMATLVSAKPGGGVIDACASLLRAARPCDCACPAAAELAADAHR